MIILIDKEAALSGKSVTIDLGDGPMTFLLHSEVAALPAALELSMIEALVEAAIAFRDATYSVIPELGQCAEGVALEKALSDLKGGE